MMGGGDSETLKSMHINMGKSFYCDGNEGHMGMMGSHKEGGKKYDVGHRNDEWIWMVRSKLNVVTLRSYCGVYLWDHLLVDETFSFR
jgi:hypothetical protein